MKQIYDDEYTLQALALADNEFEDLVCSLIGKGMDDGDIGYRYWWNIAHSLKMAKMQLVLCRMAVSHIEEKPESIKAAFDLVDEWEEKGKSDARNATWKELMQRHEWNKILEISLEGLKLREINPIRFVLPESITNPVVRHYYR